MNILFFLLIYLLFRFMVNHEDREERTNDTGDWRRQQTGSSRSRDGYYQNRYGGNAQRDFIEALLVLIAAMMKADGQPKKVELEYVKTVLKRSFDEDTVRKALLRLRDILKMNMDVNRVCMSIRYSVSYSTRLEIIHILFGIAMADGVVTDSEKNLVSQIGYAIGLSVADIESLFGTYKTYSSDNIDDAYKVLEITKSATDDEVKKAYRMMAKKYHPDTVAELGEEAQKEAEVKFKKLKEAYEKIKESRGMK
ncbi:MAG: TerB family tellurite resistance protein [Bacteroidales bacterium]|nr:TerB family tellurite resistance protein [Bacteroidales bacterium]